MSNEMIWFILAMTFLLLLAGTICFAILMYWLSSKYSQSKLPEIVHGYMQMRGRAKVIEAEAMLEEAKRGSPFDWEIKTKQEVKK